MTEPMSRTGEAGPDRGPGADAGPPAAAEAPAAAGPPAAAQAPATGVAAADEARRRLDEVESVPLEEHVELFEDVHRRLQEGLADLDEQ